MGNCAVLVRLTLWLTNRLQCVTVDGTASRLVQDKSGVPQGTVLGPLLFLLYINNIRYGISSTLRLFADDCTLYCVIDSSRDTHISKTLIYRLMNYTLVQGHTRYTQIIIHCKSAYVLCICTCKTIDYKEPANTRDHLYIFNTM